VPRSLRAFRRAYPDVELILEELNSPQLLDQLSRQRIDAAFIRPGKESPPGFTVTPLDDEPMMVVVPSGHRLDGQQAVNLAELKGEPFVLFSRVLGPGPNEEIAESCRRAGFEPVVAQLVPQVTTIANLVAAEFGVSIVPAQLASINNPGVVFLPITGNAPVARLALATGLDDRSVVTRNFRALAREVARTSPSTPAVGVQSGRRKRREQST
jgi:DNA-binding transcriptional LysR family regulator